MALEIAELTPWLLSDEETIPVESGSENILVSSKLHNGQLIIMVVNRVNEPYKAEIRIRRSVSGKASVLFENRSVTISGGYFSDQIQAFGSQVYMVDINPYKETVKSYSKNLIKYPGLWYQQSKDERYKQAVFGGIEKYDINHGQAGGRFSGDEHLSGKSPSRGTELCSVVEYMFSLETLYEIFGDNKLADRLELLTFNALPGTTTPDMWAHQYDQQSNQVLVSAAKRDWSTNGDYSNIYGLMPNFACCLANMHQGWPKFVESMWMATNDNGLIAVAYGPSRVKAMVGNSKEVTILEETDYPFNGRIKLTISTYKPVKFPIYLRIPGFGSAKITYGNKNESGTTGSTVTLVNRWKNGDQIIIDIPLNLRFENRYNNSVSLLRGPLYFSLRIDKEYKNTRINYDNFGFKGSVDWEILPKNDWNYGIMIDKGNPDRNVIVTVNPVGSYPFADYGDMVWSADSGAYIKWIQDAPVVIKTRGIKIPEWTMKNNSAD